MNKIKIAFTALAVVTAIGGAIAAVKSTGPVDRWHKNAASGQCELICSSQPAALCLDGVGYKTFEECILEQNPETVFIP